MRWLKKMHLIKRHASKRVAIKKNMVGNGRTALTKNGAVLLQERNALMFSSKS